MYNENLFVAMTLHMLAIVYRVKATSSLVKYMILKFVQYFFNYIQGDLAGLP